MLCYGMRCIKQFKVAMIDAVDSDTIPPWSELVFALIIQ